MGTDINIKKKIAAKEEGVTITNDLSSLNFVGAGVTASIIADEVTVTVPGSIGSTAYYLNETVTQTPYKEFSSVPTTAAEQDTPTTVAVGVTSVIGAYQTPSGVPNTTSIPAGLWQFFLHLYSNSATDDWDVYVEVYKRDLGGIETLLFTSDVETVINMSTSTTMYLLDGVFPTTSLLTTDRIVVKVLATNTGSGSQTIHMVTEGSAHYSVGTTTLNQVVGAGSVTAVTGTAPIASSGGTTPAISISQATSSTDGYLSSADWNTFNSKRGQGIWGIADASGVYTYYTTLTLAMAASTSGQTIEMFADVTETTATAITLKNGVNINGNGHTYNYTATTGNCFIDNGVAVTCTIQNLIVNRTNHSSGSVWTITSGSTNIDFLGSKTYMTSASAGDYVATLTGTIQNLWVKGIGTSVRGTFGGTLYNCYAEVTGGGYGITQLFPNATDCVGISVSGRGFYVYEDGTLTRCYGKSTSNYGMYCETSGTNLVLYNCTCISTSGVALYVRGSKVYTTTAISTSGVAINCAFASNQIFNSSIRSASSNAINGQAGDKCYNTSCIADGSSSVAGGVITSNSVIICNWNNANGFAYTSAVVNAELTNSFLQVTNASANCIYATAPVSFKYANNIYKGSTTPVNANVTQLITNTQDNQGNILM